MDQLLLMLVVGLGCLVMPFNLLVAAGVVGVMLADTRLVPGGVIYLTRFVPLGVLCVRVLGAQVLAPRREPTAHTMLKLWFPFLGLAAASSLYSLDPGVTFQRSLSAGLVIVGFGLGVPLYLGDAKRSLVLTRLLAAIMGGATAYSVSMAPWRSSMALVVDEYQRLHGVFKNPNTLGLIGMQSLFLFLLLWHSGKRLMARRAYLAGAAASGLAVILSGSRASALGVAVGLLVFVWGNGEANRRNISAFVAVIFLLGVAFGVTDFLFPEFARGLFRSDTSSRTVLWERAWVLSRGAPWLGAGFGGGERLFTRDILYLRSIGIYISGSHSSLMRLLVDLGYAGVVLAVGAFAVLIRRAVRFLPRLEDPRLGAALLGLIAASLVNSIFESWLFGFGSASTVPFWLFLAIMSHEVDRTEARLRAGGAE